MSWTPWQDEEHVLLNYSPDPVTPERPRAPLPLFDCSECGSGFLLEERRDAHRVSCDGGWARVFASRATS